MSKTGSSSVPSSVLSAEQKAKLENLKADLEELREGAEAGVPAPDFSEDFLNRLIRADSAYATLPRKFLDACGFGLKAPDEIDDGQLHAELWRVIWVMALLRLLLQHTDHLGDRELYERIYDVELAEPTNFQPGERDAPIYVCDLLGGYGPDEIRLLLTYYSDRLEAGQVGELKASLAGDIPAPRERPYDRDRHLP